MKNINEIMLAAHAVESVDSEGNSPEVYTEATGKGSYAISSYGRVALDTAALHLFKPPGLAHRGHGDFKTDGDFTPTLSISFYRNSILAFKKGLE